MSQSSVATTPDNVAKEESRRSTRIDRSVPLIVLGQNRIGEPIVERTVSTSVNLHGCRYPSRHDYGVGTWVTLQVVGLNVEPKPPAIRARVRSIHPSQSTRELQQVGVELESPSNVWGIISPPPDWLSFAETNGSMPQFTVTETIETILEPLPSPFETETAEIEEQQESPASLEQKLAEVATFPSPSPAAPRPPASAHEAPEPERVVLSPDNLLNALQEKLQLAAEKAVQAAAAEQVEEAVRNAVTAIDDVRLSSIREVQQLLRPQGEARLATKDEVAAVTASVITAHWKAEMEKYRANVEQLTQKLARQATELKRELDRCQKFLEKMNNELEPRAEARLNEAVARVSADFDGAAARIMERRFERLLKSSQAMIQEGLLKLDARSSEAQALVQSSVNSTLAALQRQAESQMNAMLAETKDRRASALSSLDAENRAACEERRRALEAEVARAAERSTVQLRKGMKAFLYSCLVAAVSAVDEHSKSTLENLTKDNGKSLEDASEAGGSADPDGPEILPAPDTDPFTH